VVEATFVIPTAVPPVKETALVACVAILPKPKEVRAVAPVSRTKFDPSPTIKLLSVGLKPAMS